MGGGCEGGKSASWALPSAGVLAPRSVSLPRPLSSRSYVFSSLATSAVSFATGALGMWIPLYLHRAQVVQKTAETCSSPPCGAKDRWGRAWGSGPGAGGRWGGGVVSPAWSWASFLDDLTSPIPPDLTNYCLQEDLDSFNQLLLSK